jgi:GxxExxY protein
MTSEITEKSKRCLCDDKIGGKAQSERQNVLLGCTTIRTRGEDMAGGVTEQVIGCAIAVHRVLGPGLLESAYEECLCYELAEQGLAFARQVDLPIVYKGVQLECGYRMDIVVENWVLVELKTVDELLSVHEAQLLTYLRLSKLRTGLLINFHTRILRDGIRRRVL